MKTILTLLCAVALGLTIIPPCLVCASQLSHPLCKQLMLAGAVLWFAAAIPLGRK